MQYKIQYLDPDWGWVHATRAGPTLDNAKNVLAGYRRDYPSDKYRLVSVSEGGAITVIPDEGLRAAWKRAGLE